MHNIRNLVTLFLVLSILDIIRSGQHVLLHSLHGLQLVLVKLGHAELSRHTLGTRVVTQTRGTRHSPWPCRAWRPG